MVYSTFLFARKAPAILWLAGAFINGHSLIDCSDKVLHKMFSRLFIHFKERKVGVEILELDQQQSAVLGSAGIHALDTSFDRVPLEQIWKEIRKRGFKNEIFQTLNKVDDRLCDTIRSISAETIISITARDWIVKAFN